MGGDAMHVNQAQEAYMPVNEPLGKRLGRFMALMGTVFMVTVGIVVTQRLSADALAMLIGMVFGLLAMLPLVGLIALLWRRDATRRTTTSAPLPAQAPSPPVIVVSPAALPQYSNQPQAWREQSATMLWANAPNERQFTIVGGTE
jgi:hypothetical protein